MRILLINLLVIFSCNFTYGQEKWNTMWDTGYHYNGNLSRYSTTNLLDSTRTLFNFYLNGAISSISKHNMKGMDTPSMIQNSVFFNPDGSVVAVVPFNNEGYNLHGTFIEFYNNHQMKRLGNFYNERKSGVWNEFFPNGKMQSSGVYYLSSRDSIDEFARDGKMKMEEFELNYGEIIADTVSTKEIFIIPLSMKDGKWEYWNEKGKLIKVEEYKMGELIRRKEY